MHMRRLTATEVRLAAAVTAGRTNAEIAAALDLAPATIETAVSDVCRKLGVSSRSELALLLGALGDAARTDVGDPAADAADAIGQRVQQAEVKKGDSR